MTSAAKIAANRRNAQRSTGPRTGAGKARSRGNSLKHGLAVPIARDSVFADRIKELTAELGRTIPKPTDRIESAASAYAELERVQQLWTELLGRAAASVTVDTVDSGEQASKAVHTAVQLLPCLTRYERRAISNLRKVLRDLEKP
jgi:hypothetical protein